MPADSLVHESIREVQMMVSSTSLWQRTKQITLSVPVQTALLTSLCALIIWTLYFSTYPPVHDALHTTRHNTAAVACH
jgi:hypothetical protein